MITLSNFVKQVDDYVLLLTMGAHDTADMLPTAQRPFSPEYYPVSVDYGVPAAGSVAINYFTQENFVFVNGAWGKDSVPSVLEQLTAVENKVYTPDAGVDGYDKVTVNVPQLDTSDATAVAADILSPKTAYVNGAKVTGTLGTQIKTVTPSSASQTITPDTGKLLSSVVVEAAPMDDAKTVAAGTSAKTVSPSAGKLGIKSVTIEPTPSSPKTVAPTKSIQNVTPEEGELLSGVTVNAIPPEYIIPTGSTTITTNGTHNISNFAEAVVNVPTKSKVGTVIGTATTVQDVTRYQVEYATLKGIMDASDELVFKLSDSEYTRPLMTFYNAGISTSFEIVDYLDSQSDIGRTVSTKIIYVVDSNGEDPNALTDEQRTFLDNNIVSKVPYNIYNYYT